jgi:flagellar protein FliS
MSATWARAAATYQTVQVTSRSPLELVVMLYDGAIRALGQARDALARRDLVAKRAAMNRALDIVHHLQSSLDMEAGGEIAARLDALYSYVIERLLEANRRADHGPVDEAVRLLSTLREAWAQIAEAPPAAPR